MQVQEFVLLMILLLSMRTRITCCYECPKASTVCKPSAIAAK